MNFNKIIVLAAILSFFLMGALCRAQAVPANNFVLHKFVSCIDGKEDYYALVAGKPFTKNGKVSQNDTLIVYLHTLGNDFNEPFKLSGESSLASAITKAYPTATFVSLNYGSSLSWGSAVARVDITNNLRNLIRELKINKIILVGNTMGATTALTYIATAPSPIKEKIVGIVAIDPCANLEDLYKQSNDPQVKTSLETGLGAVEKPTVYQQNSFDSYLAFMPTKIKVGIISATGDTVVPIGLQKDVVRDLNNRDIPLNSTEIEGKSEPLPIKVILESLRFVME